jgi:putative protease
MKLPELLVPAGNLEKLKIAVHYGADAVYLSGKKYGLRSYAGNFTLTEMEEGVAYAHAHQVKVYATVNIIARNQDLADLPEYLHRLGEIGVDGLIVSDPGVILQVRQCAPRLPLHLSTQLSTANWLSAQFWREQGISRINLARELSLQEITTVKQKVPLEVEIFIHGALCIAHSGRCLLSTYLASRDANRGECAHPCRWKYALVEETRPHLSFPITEDEYGSYLFNSKDLCLIEYLPQVIATGVDALKIEGRMKGIHYVAGVTRVYRHALDCYANNPQGYRFHASWLEELKKISHRDYTTGFYLHPPSPESCTYQSSDYIRTHELVGVVKESVEKAGTNSHPALRVVKLQVRNRLAQGEEVEVINRYLNSYRIRVEEMVGEQGERVEVAHPGEQIVIETDLPIGVNDLVRREKTSC